VPDVQQYVLRDGLRRRQVTGWLVAVSSTERRGKVRWTELELYRGCELNVEAEAFFLQTIGQTVIYHWPDAGCGGGSVPVPWDELPEDGLPCRECRPPALPPEGEPRGEGPVLYLESTRPRLYRCWPASEVIRQLLMYDGKLSAPAETLLERASAADPEMAAALEAYAEGAGQFAEEPG
jgi:hypothetical protein